MEKFNLNTWLEDKSRKIVTRDGKPARIVCYNVKQGKQDDCYAPIIALVDKGEEIGEMSFYYSEDGSFLKSTNQTHKLDLFFADDENTELTEFEKALSDIIGFWQQGNYVSKDIKTDAKKLLDLARKEIETENSEFKPKFTYNEKDYSELANKLIEFRNNTPLCSVSYRDGEGRKVILHYEKEIFDLVRNEIEKENPYSGNQKQEWSEEDKKKQDAIIGILDFQANKAPDRCCATDGFLLDELIDWLKSFKPQPEQEWSEEDKSMYIRTLGILGKCYMGELPTKVEEELNWFKSIEPKSHWKPSEEQMEALFEAKLASIKNREYFLGLLYEDLKKL